MKKEIVILISVLLFIISGCTQNNAEQNRNTLEKNPVQQVTYKNKKLTEKQEELINLQKEWKIRKYVLNTRVVEHKKVVKADLTVENNTPTKSAKELGKEYVEDLKQAYEDKKIEVQVIRKGKIIATVKRQPIF